MDQIQRVLSKVSFWFVISLVSIYDFKVYNKLDYLFHVYAKSQIFMHRNNTLNNNESCTKGSDKMKQLILITVIHNKEFNYIKNRIK